MWAITAAVIFLTKVVFSQQKCFLENKNQYGVAVGNRLTDLSRLESLTTATRYHKISSVKHCVQLLTDGSKGQLLSLQFELRESRNGEWQDPTFLLNQHGQPSDIERKECGNWVLGPDEDITDMIVFWSTKGITNAQLFTSQKFLNVGARDLNDFEGSFTLGGQGRYRLIGLSSFETTYITQISAIAFDSICNPNPRPPALISTLKNLPNVTDAGIVGLSWQKANVGQDALGYSIWYDQGTQGEFVLLSQGVTDLFFVARGLQVGQTYEFKIKANNENGSSDFSNLVRIKAAGKPLTPLAPTTEWVPGDIVIKWLAPGDGGSPITGYIVLIQIQGTTIFRRENLYCNTTTSTATQCIVPGSALLQAPFSYDWGDQVKAKIIAINSYGQSIASASGGSGILGFPPDPSQSVTIQNQDDSISISWTLPKNVYAPIIGYQVLIRTNVSKEFFLEQTYCKSTTVVQNRSCLVPLTHLQSSPYLLQVGSPIRVLIYTVTALGRSAKPAQGTGALMQSVPDAPTGFTSETSDQLVKIAWKDGLSSGGLPILEYFVYVAEENQLFKLVQRDLQQQYETNQFTKGLNYSFYVTARNQVGTSKESATFSVIAARVPDAPSNLLKNAQLTTKNQISITWFAQYNGGSPILDYSVWSDRGSGQFEEVASQVKSTEFTLEATVPGVNLQLKVKARNIIGSSDFSETLSINTAQKPLKPEAPVTIWSPDDVIIRWIEPDDTGSPITGYSVLIRQSDALTYSPELSNCDMQNQTGLTCRIPSTVLRDDPFNLPWGSQVFAKVQAKNEYGASELSDSGSGAVIITKPNAPTILAENKPLRSESSSTIEWSTPTEDGGTPVLDYKVTVSGQDAQSKVFESVQQPFQIKSLVRGQTYVIQVQARNSYGFSDFSESITVLFTYKPDPPTNLKSQLVKADSDKILISWDESKQNGGSPVLAYTVWLLDNSTSEFSIASLATNASFTLAQVELGRTYTFKLQASNEFFTSDFSEAVSILAGYAPFKPDAPVITRQDDQVTVAWIAPSDSGSPITGYLVTVRTSDGVTFTQESKFCDMTISTKTTCTIPVASLKQSPFNLTWGAQVYAKVQAINSFGLSDQSEPGSGVTIITKADAPLKLREDLLKRSANAATLLWTRPEFVGGSKTLRYQVTQINPDQSVTIFDGIEQTQKQIGDLVLGQSYQFKVQSRSEYGLSDFSDFITVFFVNRPSEPIYLQFDQKVSDDTKIKISWREGASNGGSAILDYFVFFAETSGEFIELAKGLTLTEYTTAVPLKPGSTYTFKVKARNGLGESDFSKPIEVLAARVPDAPLSLINVEQITAQFQVGLQWAKPIYDGGSPIIDYQITKISDQFETAATYVTTNLTAAVLTGLEPDTQYKFYVRARNIKGQGFQSSTLQIKTLAYASNMPPSAVTGLQKISNLTNASQIVLSWLAPQYDGGTPVIDYSVWCDLGTGQLTEIAASVTETQFLLQETEQGKSYQFKVKARNAVGQSVFSDAENIVAAQQPAKPDQPFTSLESDRVIVMWSEPDNGGLPITGYNVLIRQSDQITFQPEPTSCDMTKSADTICLIPVNLLREAPFDLPWGSQIFVKVQAINSQGLSEKSEEGSGAVIITQPSAPQNLTENQQLRSKNQVGLTWNKPDFVGGASIQDYTITVVNPDESEFSRSGISGTSYLFQSTQEFKIGLSYRFIVQARNQYGLSDFSKPLNISFYDRPSSPISITRQSITANNFRLSWEDGTSNGGQPVIEYTVYQAEGLGEFIQVSRVTEKHYTTGELKFGLTYSFRITSRTNQGESDFSQILTALVATAPQAPINLAAETTKEHIILTWQESYDGGSPIQGYVITQISPDGSEQAFSQTLETQFQASELQNGDSYTFKVQAFNAFGTSENSKSISVIFQEKPDAPIYLQFDQKVSDDTKIKISWREGASNGGSAILDYFVFFAEASGEFIELAKGLTLTEYTTAVPLKPGFTYTFKVKARNGLGESDFSKPIQVLAARVPDAPKPPQNLNQITNVDKIGLSWSTSYYDGGSPILDYTIWWDQGTSNNFFVLAEKVLSTNYILNGPNRGRTYKFRVQARNVLGAGDLSDSLTIVYKFVPNTPTQVRTENQSSKVLIKWLAPDANNLPITEYKVYIQQNDKTLKQVACQSQDQVCTVQMSTVIEQFGLVAGDGVRAAVVAVNEVGDSLYSAIGEGAFIFGVPNPPVNLQITSVSDRTIQISWQTTDDNAQAPVLDYTVFYTSGSQQNIKVVEEKRFQIDTEPGKTYSFRVRARNAIGNSDEATLDGVLAVRVPDQPLIVRQVVEEAEITLQVASEYDGGSPVLEYVAQVGSVIIRIAGSQVTFKELNAGTQYTLSVQARNIKGLSAPATLTFTTPAPPQNDIPAQPEALQQNSDQTGTIVGAIVGSIVVIAIGLAFAFKLRSKNHSLLTSVLPQEQSQAPSFKPDLESQTEIQPIIVQVENVDDELGPSDSLQILIQREPLVQTPPKQPAELPTQEISDPQLTIDQEPARPSSPQRLVCEPDSPQSLQETPHKYLTVSPQKPQEVDMHTIAPYQDKNHLDESTLQHKSFEQPTISVRHEHDFDATYIPVDSTVSDYVHQITQVKPIASIISDGRYVDSIQQSYRLTNHSEEQQKPQQLFSTTQHLDTRSIEIKTEEQKQPQPVDDNVSDGMVSSLHEQDCRDSEIPIQIKDQELQDHRTQSIAHEQFRPKPQTLNQTQSTLGNHDEEARVVDRGRPYLTNPMFENSMVRPDLVDTEMNLVKGKKGKKKKQGRRTAPYNPQQPTDEEAQLALSEDEVLVMMRNLWEKKALGIMNSLDRKLLLTLQSLIDKNPKNYSSKVGYLQFIYQ